jgi:hydrogenase nickel incorporation protein HypA/HybF
MHEMGIASSVLEAVDQESHRQAGCRATKVGLRIGEYAAVDQDSLRFAFEVLARDADRIPVELEIEFRPACDDLAIAFIEFDDEAAKEATV